MFGSVAVAYQMWWGSLLWQLAASGIMAVHSRGWSADHDAAWTQKLGGIANWRSSYIEWTSERRDEASRSL